MQIRILGYFSHFLHIFIQHQSHPLPLPSQGCHTHLSKLLARPGMWARGVSGSGIQQLSGGKGRPFTIHREEPQSCQHSCPGLRGSHPCGPSPHVTCFSTLFLSHVQAHSNIHFKDVHQKLYVVFFYGDLLKIMLYFIGKQNVVFPSF